MKRLIVALALLVITCFCERTQATGFSNPLATMENIYGFGGTHIGVDLDGVEGDPVYAIADGQVFYYKSNAEAYGGGGGSCANTIAQSYSEVIEEYTLQRPARSLTRACFGFRSCGPYPIPPMSGRGPQL